MNREQTAHLLTAMAAYDRRTIGEGEVIAWQELLADVAYADGLQAVKRWYAENTEWMMPSHVLRLVGAIRKERSVSVWAPGQRGVPRNQVESLPPVSDRRAGADMVRHVLQRLREAGSDPTNGQFLGKERCGDIAEEAVHEWLQQTAQKASPGATLRSHDYYDTQATAGPSGEPPVQRPNVGICPVCQCQSEDLSGHRADYPNSSCA